MYIHTFINTCIHTYILHIRTHTHIFSRIKGTIAIHYWFILVSLSVSLCLSLCAFVWESVCVTFCVPLPLLCMCMFLIPPPACVFFFQYSLSLPPLNPEPQTECRQHGEYKTRAFHGIHSFLFRGCRRSRWGGRE